MPRYSNILETIGGTPLVRVNKLAPAHVELYVKIESFNPMGSVKDRAARAIIEDAERSGALRPGQTVIEATSGNTGIALAMVCAQKGYPLVVTMAENFSIERRKLLRFLGASVVLTPAAAKGSGMLAKAVELAAAHGYFLCRQFENEANAAAHSLTTAREVLADFAGERLDYWVSGYGTGGTLKGVARELRRMSPGTRIVVAEPDNAQILGSGIAQQRDAEGRPARSHQCFRPHLMQGWTPDFIPRLTEEAVAAGFVDEIVPVSGEEALRLTRELARQEGILAGTSSGATLAAALCVARRSEPGTSIVCMLPDTGERYLSTPLFDGIAPDMTAEERALADSTPGHRLDSRPGEPDAGAQFQTDAAAVRLFQTLVRDHAVTIFALEWCEFCASVRKLLTKLGIAYRSVDLDSPAFRAEGLGERLRGAVAQHTGAATIPQIFIGGQSVGGCLELFEAHANGSLQRRLCAARIACDASVAIDPYSLLPVWAGRRNPANGAGLIPSKETSHGVHRDHSHPADR